MTTEPNVRMIFEDNAAWEQHLAEQAAEVQAAYDRGYTDGFNFRSLRTQKRPSDDDR